MKKITNLMCMLVLFGGILNAQSYQEAGKCYAKCVIPAEYQTVTEQVMTSAGSTRLDVVAPAYETVTEKVMVKPAGYKLVAAPGSMTTVTEQIMIKPETVKMIPVPATYETVTERVMTKEETRRIIPVPAKYETVVNDVVYVGDATGISISKGSLSGSGSGSGPGGGGAPGSGGSGGFFTATTTDGGANAAYVLDLTSPDSPFNPNNPNNMLNADFFNPNSPNSPLNPSNPNSPLNPNNPNSPLNPSNPNYNSGGAGSGGFGSGSGSGSGGNAGSGGAGSGSGSGAFGGSGSGGSRGYYGAGGRNVISYGTADATTLGYMNTGTILPYLIKEAMVKIDRKPAQYDTETETIETQSASTKWVQKRGDRNCLSADPNDCLVWCLVEVPAQYKTITKKVRRGCASGYVQAGKSGSSRDECLRVTYTPAQYGARTIMVSPPSYREEVIPAEYTTVTKQVIKTPATVREEVIPAQYKTITKRVTSGAPNYVSVYVAPEYKTVTRRVRKGLKRMNYIDPTGILVMPAGSRNSGAGADNTGTRGYPGAVNPGLGYPISGVPGNGFPSYNPFDNLNVPGDPSSGVNGAGGYPGGTYPGGTNPGGTYPGGTNPDGSNPGGGTGGMGGIGSGSGAGGGSGSGISPLNVGDVDNFYSAGCPSGYTFDPKDGTCKRLLTTPAEYSTVTKRVVTNGGGISEWREVLCQGNVTSDKTRQIQNALRARGYDPGPADNVMGARTKAALVKFQKDNGLPVGQLDFETLKALGVRY